MEGSSFADTMTGGDDDDVLAGWGGDDVIDGGGGNDRADFSGNFSDYSIVYDAEAVRFTITDLTATRDGRNLVSNVESFQFNDVVKTAAQEYDCQVLGGRVGFDGFVNPGGVYPLGLNDVRGILPRGGTILGTANRGNPFARKVIRNGVEVVEDISAPLIANIRALELDALIVVGGDGTLTNEPVDCAFRTGLSRLPTKLHFNTQTGKTAITFTKAPKQANLSLRGELPDQQVFTGGEMLPYPRAVEFEDRTGAVLLQFYGSNETGALSKTTLRDDREIRLRTAGRVLPGMHVILVDDDDNDVTAGGGPAVPACKGPLLSLGYDDDVVRGISKVLPASSTPLVRYPQFYGLDGRNLGLSFDDSYKFIDAPRSFEDAVFSKFKALGTPSDPTAFQLAYNDQVKNKLDVTGPILHIDAPSAEKVLESNAASRLGIPLLIADDCIRGHSFWPGATLFPSQLAQGCSWNVDLIEAAARATAVEVAATGIVWTFSPVLCIARDPRWGRVDETFGEDPLLIGELGPLTERRVDVRGVSDRGAGPQSLFCAVDEFLLGLQHRWGAVARAARRARLRLFEAGGVGGCEPAVGELLDPLHGCSRCVALAPGAQDVVEPVADRVVVVGRGAAGACCGCSVESPAERAGDVVVAAAVAAVQVCETDARVDEVQGVLSGR